MKYTMTPMRMSIGSMLVSKETQVGVVETSATYLTSGWDAMSSASESVPRYVEVKGTRAFSSPILSASGQYSPLMV